MTRAPSDPRAIARAAFLRDRAALFARPADPDGQGATRVLGSDEAGRPLSRCVLGRARDGRGALRDLVTALPPRTLT